MPKSDILSWSQVKNWLPIVSGSLVIAGAFFSVRTELAVMKEKLDQVVTAQEKYLQKEVTHDDKLNNHETRISVLEVKKTSQTSGQSAQLVSRPTIKPEPTIQAQVNTPETHTQSVVIQQVQPTPQPNQQEKPEPTPEPIITIPIISQLLEKL